MQSTDIESTIDTSGNNNSNNNTNTEVASKNDNNISTLEKIAQHSQRLTFVPWIIIAVLQNGHEMIAIWLAFGIALVLAMMNYYNSTLHPQYSSWYYIDASLLVSVLGLGIANSIVYVPHTLLSVIPLTAMLATVAISMILQYPFTMQYAKAKVSNPKLKFHQILSGYYLIVFSIMVTSVWCALLFVAQIGPPMVYSNHIAYIILGTVVPIFIGLIAPMGTKKIIEHLRGSDSSKDNNNNVEDNNNNL